MNYRIQKGYRDNGNNSLSLYIQEISKKPVLTKEVEKELGKRIQEGDESALKELVEHNLRFGVKYAKKVFYKYNLYGMELIDLIGAANIGLIEAAKRFDYKKDVRFISYAVWWIRQKIAEAIIDQIGAVNLDSRGLNLLGIILKESNKIFQITGREPSVYELAEKLNIEHKEIENVLRSSKAYYSLYAEIPGCERSTLADIIKAKSNDTDEILSKHQLVEIMLGMLRPRERWVLERRYGLNSYKRMKLREIGDEMGISRERVRQIEKRAIERLRKLAKRKKLEVLV